MITKTKSSARWNGLAARHRETLEAWLFEENLGFGEALERARTELGFAGSLSSLKRFYHRTADERMIEEYAEQAASEAGADDGDWLAKGMNVVGKLFVRQVTQNPDGVEEWWRLAKLLLQNRGNELRERLQGEENRIRRDYLALARERHQYDVLEEAEKALPELKERERLRQDPKVQKYEHNRAINLLMRKMFGVALNLKPESEEQEGRMAELQAQEMERVRKIRARKAAETFRDLLARDPKSAAHALDTGLYPGLELTEDELARVNAARRGRAKADSRNDAAAEPADLDTAPRGEPDDVPQVSEAEARERCVGENIERKEVFPAQDSHTNEAAAGKIMATSLAEDEMHHRDPDEPAPESMYPYGQ
jgi:hypothetical protein